MCPPNLVAFIIVRVVVSSYAENFRRSTAVITRVSPKVKWFNVDRIRNQLEAGPEGPGRPIILKLDEQSARCNGSSSSLTDRCN